jgi:UDP-N-acetylglucosamine--N-acetylmuramyl-(pentapeptide) pyrophosphoryl-undecaprenol N-acetylglucosamine transferase
VWDVANVNKDEALRFFNLQPGKQTVLAVGGSLGARSINEAIAAGLDSLLGADMQLIWQTGKTDAARWKALAKGKRGVWVSEFITNMQLAYAAADFVISRAGAMAVAELCLVEKPVLFVPYPFAAEDHQTVNAQHLVQKGAALMVKDSEAKEKIIPAIMGLAGDGQKQQDLKNNIAGLGVGDADVRIAEEILKTIGS